jgi:hypothetical protein
MGVVVDMPFVLFAGVGFICINLLVCHAGIGPSSAHAAVTIAPSKVTLFAGEALFFVATVIGLDNKTVDWAVLEENGGTITDSAYIRPQRSKASITSPRLSEEDPKFRPWPLSPSLHIAIRFPCRSDGRLGLAPKGRLYRSDHRHNRAS